MVSESEENGNVVILLTTDSAAHHRDNSDFESGPNFHFQQVLNDVTTPLTTPTPTRRR